MQTDYRYNWIKGYKRFARFCYRLGMISEEANQRYKILQFFERYGLEATKEAYGVSRRTLYRWKSILKNSNGDISSLNPKSTKPHKKREPQTPKIIIDEIKKLREEYPNIGKEKIHYMLKSWCKSKELKLPSISTIGRIISRDKDKMRFAPPNIDHNGKVKPKKKKFKNRKPKNLKSKPMHLWAVDTIQRVSNGIRRYIMTIVDPNSRIAFALALPSKHSKHTAKVLEALIDGLSGSITFQTNPKEFAILSDNGSEFLKDFESLLQEKGLTHYLTYPKNPKMNAHNERFNRTIQEQFVDYYEDLLFTDIDLFNQDMADWLIDYNTFIPHHSLNMKTPVQYLLENHIECHMLWTDTIS